MKRRRSSGGLFLLSFLSAAALGACSLWLALSEKKTTADWPLGGMILRVDETALLVGCAVVLFVLYFLPFLIAVLRRHPSTAAIFAVDLLLGWSGVPWVIALAWSLSAIKVGQRYR